MTRANILALVVTIVFVAGVGVGTGFAGLMAWALALNGFMGREFIVNVSMFTYLGLTVILGPLSVAFAALTTHRLAVRSGWNSVGASALSIVIFSIFVCVAHLVCVILSALVASLLWKI